MIRIPCCIIGDGITGVSMSFELAKNNIDSIVLQGPKVIEKDSAFLNNMSTFQSGILQSFKYKPGDFSTREFLKDGTPKVADYLFHLQSSRTKLNSINDEISDFISSEEGVLNIPKKYFENTLKEKLSILNFDKYSKPLDEDIAKGLCGRFYRDDGSIYINIPDTTFDLDAIVQLLKKEILNTKDPKPGKTIFIPSQTTDINIKKQEGQYLIRKDGQAYLAETLVLAAGFNNDKILKLVDETYEDSSTSLGFVLSLTPNVKNLNFKAPFFTRVSAGETFSTCKHIYGINAHEYVLISNIPNNDIDFNNSYKKNTYTELKNIHDKDCSLKRDSIVSRIAPYFIDGDKIKNSSFSFCIHTSGNRKYEPNYNFQIEENLFNIQPGLATNCFHLVEKTCNKIKSRLTTKNIVKEDISKLTELALSNHKDIKNTTVHSLKQRAWYKTYFQ